MMERGLMQSTYYHVAGLFTTTSWKWCPIGKEVLAFAISRMGIQQWQ